MTTGVGTGASFGFAIETTKGTRVAPNRFTPFLSETLKANQEFIRSAALSGGRQYGQRKALGSKLPGGGISFELQPQTTASLLRLCFGGSVVTTGAGPYTHTMAGGVLPSATMQILTPQVDTITNEERDYLGAMVNGWTINCTPGEFVTLDLDIRAFDEVINQAAATYAPSATITPFTFQHLTLTAPDVTICPDSVTLTGNNNLVHDPKSCATDAGRAYPKPGGMKTVTGSIELDFVNFTAYSRMLAGTEGALVLAFNAGAGTTLTITMNVFYTDAAMNVSGPGPVKQSLPFEVISATSDAAAITAVLVNSDATA
jgi:hypothetical protein